MLLIKYLVTIICSYLLGSLSASILLSKAVLGADVRNCGSGNAGATNMARVYGWKAGIITLVCDSLKAAASMLLGYLLLGDVGLAIGGCACAVGHCFPVFHGFRGGKGVSVGAAIALAVDWRVFAAVVVAFAVAVLLSKKVSLGSLCSAVMITVSAALVGVSTPRLILCICAMALVIFQHRENIKRLIAGTESDFSAGHSAKKLHDNQ